jgi:hypothetical protein
MGSGRSRRSAAGMLSTALIVALAATGCGSSSKKPALSKQQFLAKANGVCTAGNNRLTAAANKLGNSPTLPQVVRYVRTVFVPDIQGQINAVRPLADQTADKAKLDGMLNLAQADLDKVKATPSLAVNAKVFHNFAQQAHPYGLTACAPQS